MRRLVIRNEVMNYMLELGFSKKQVRDYLYKNRMATEGTTDHDPNGDYINYFDVDEYNLNFGSLGFESKVTNEQITIVKVV